ncbi:tail fiber protein [Fulvivirgaceae bacterium PWU4]|uniref:Tail fiber protein n=1 Tax=Chryseosolibacter histidini TaxID=2782349 RepID=A0AAP2GL86_9BACT|nr:tail fiber protein [Chryseosolibacter histidini]MBT1699864.1 tail fiber protein [Chryseosolibacter histidini]
MDAYLGEIRIFSGNYAPAGWMLCAGQTLQVSEYQALFAVIGDMYGGDGSSTFMLPDLRGRTVVGLGQGPNLTNRTIGEKDGEEAVTLDNTEIPAHAHSIPQPQVTVTSAGTASADLYAYNGNANSKPITTGSSLAVINDGARSPALYNTVNTSNAPNVKLNSASIQNITVPAIQVNVAMPATTGVIGASNAHDNMMPYIVLTYIICVSGYFPSKQ